MKKQYQVGLLFSALLVALGGIIYELIIGAVSSYLLGDGVLQYSLTIGLMLFGMGIGSVVAPRLQSNPESRFVATELTIALIGGFSPLILFATYIHGAGFFAVFTLLVVTLGCFIGLEIPFLFNLLKQNEGEGVSVLSKILALDYFGALIASLAFPLILLPTFGLVQTALLIGCGNALVASMVFFSFYDRIQAKKKLLTALIIGIILLVGTFIMRNPIERLIEQKFFRDEVVYSKHTPYQQIVMTAKQGDTRLYLNNNLQFSSADEYRYHESLAHVPMSLVKNPARLLILGGGDGLLARELLKYPTVQKITIVDIDPEMTTLAKTHPLITSINQNAFSDPRVEIKNQDALEYLKSTPAVFDVIVADLPDPNSESLAKLYARETYELIKHHLSQEGVFVTQATSPFFAKNTFWTIEDTVKSAGFQTYPYHISVPSFGEWGFVIGTIYPSVNPKLQNTHTLTHTSLPSNLRFLTPEILPLLFLFETDLQKPTQPPLEASTLLHPTILKTYLEDTAKWNGI